MTAVVVAQNCSRFASKMSDFSLVFVLPSPIARISTVVSQLEAGGEPDRFVLETARPDSTRGDKSNSREETLQTRCWSLDSVQSVRSGTRPGLLEAQPAHAPSRAPQLAAVKLLLAFA